MLTTSRATSLVQAIWEQIEAAPTLAALSLGAETITYRDLGMMVNCHAKRVAELPGDSRRPVALEIDKTPQGVALMFACMDVGYRYLVPSKQLPIDTRNALYQQAGCRSVMTVDGSHCLSPIDADPLADRQPGTLLLATSGSTGQPKVVVLTSEGVDQFTAWAADYFRIDRGTTVLNYAPLNFDLCLLDIWTTLSAGGHVVLLSAEAAVRADAIRHQIQAHHVEVVQAVPMCFALLAGVGSTPLPSVRTAISTGYALAPKVLSELPVVFPNARLYNVYGSTETNDTFVHEIDPDVVADTGQGIPIGTPINGVHVRVQPAPGDGAAVQLGQATEGELVVCSPFQADGYVSKALTQERFVPDPLGIVPESFFCTGDIAQVDDDGLFWLIGRRDSQVKIRGTAISTEQVELVVVSHPDVFEAAVFAIDDDIAGKKLACVIKRQPGAGLNSLAVRKVCAPALIKAAIPSVILIVDESLPRLSNHKVDYAQIRSDLVANSLSQPRRTLKSSNTYSRREQ